MAEVSKQVANWTLVTRTVSSALEQHGPALAGALEEALFPEGAPPELTLVGLLEAMREALQRRLAEAQARDLALAVERADDPGRRARRDEARADLRGALMAVRSAVEGAYGPETAAALGLHDPLPASPDQLAQYAQAAAQLLSEATLGEPMAGVQIDGPRLAEQLRSGAARLSTTLEGVQRESREEQERLSARDAALTALAEAYSGLADATTGLATAAGLHDVAARTRPTGRRRRGEPDADLDPPAGPAPLVDAPPPVVDEPDPA